MTEARPGADPRACGRFDRWIFGLILAIAFGIRLVAVLQYEAHHPNAAHPVIDEASYDRWAREISAGDWIGKEAFFQEPLYPYALGVLYAIAGPHRIAVRIAQCLAWAVTAALVGILAKRLFGRAAGFLAASAIALYGPGMLFPALLLKENLLLPILTLLALALVRTRDDGRSTPFAWLGVGILAGLGALLRGNILVMIPLFVLWPLARAWNRRASIAAGARHAAFVAAGVACVLLPVAIRNLSVGGEFLLTTSGAGTNLYGGNNLENPYGRATEFSFVRGVPEHEAGDWRREAQRRVGRPLGPGEVSAYWRGEALRSFREHPREHIAILWRKLRLALGRYEVPDNHFLPWDARYVPVARLPWPAFGLLGSFGLAGLLLFVLHVRLHTRRGWMSLVSPLPRGFRAADSGAAAEVVLLLLAYLGTVVLTVVSDRARLPIVPLLAPFAAWTVLWAVRAAWNRNQDALVRLALAMFLGAVPVYTRAMPDAEIAEDLAERDHNLAVQLLRESGREKEARAVAERLVREHPASARMKILLAEIDFRSGRDRSDILARVEPLADEPSLKERERFHAQSLVAWVRLERGDFPQAERRFREALVFDAESRELREGLVRALVGGGDRAQAVETRKKAEEALAILAALPAPSGNDGVPWRRELLLAQAEFLRGRAILSGPPADDAERKLGQGSVQSALDRLKPIAEAPNLDAETRGRARLLAGGIQLYRGNWKPAENHFRAVLGIEASPEAKLGLLAALIGLLEQGGDPGPSAELAGEAHRLIGELEASARLDPRFEDLRGRFARLTPPPPVPPR